jgi:hypothetical protein
MLTTHLAHVVQGFLEAPPSPNATTPPVTGGTVNTEGIKGFFVFQILPILLVGLGALFIARAGRGEVSKVLTSSGIVIIGLIFIGGAASLYLFGDTLAKTFFH